MGGGGRWGGGTPCHKMGWDSTKESMCAVVCSDQLLPCDGERCRHLCVCHWSPPVGTLHSLLHPDHPHAMCLTSATRVKCSVATISTHLTMQMAGATTRKLPATPRVLVGAGPPLPPLLRRRPRGGAGEERGAGQGAGRRGGRRRGRRRRRRGRGLPVLAAALSRPLPGAL